MHYPINRPRRLRRNSILRNLVAQTFLGRENLVMPFFVKEGKNVKKPILSMPGHFQWSVDRLVEQIRQIRQQGISAVLLFGIPRKKDDFGSQAYARDGVIQQAVSTIKQKFSDILVITDVCLCEYTSHGHCGVIKKRKPNVDMQEGFVVDNDATLELLAKTALSHVEAGADMVAPSSMMDGQVKTIRQALDDSGFIDTPIMAYSAKYASSFYAPFRQAAESRPQFGDRRSYQMDIRNSCEALREITLDIQEGADIVMVKPALAYLDIICKVKEKFNIPVAAYNVSAEYSMVKAAVKFGWIDEEKVIFEILTSIRRAGADIIITYHAREVAVLLNKGFRF